MSGKLPLEIKARVPPMDWCTSRLKPWAGRKEYLTGIGPTWAIHCSFFIFFHYSSPVAVDKYWLQQPNVVVRFVTRQGPPRVDLHAVYDIELRRHLDGWMATNLPEKVMSYRRCLSQLDGWTRFGSTMWRNWIVNSIQGLIVIEVMNGVESSDVYASFHFNTFAVQRWTCSYLKVIVAASGIPQLTHD